MKSAIFLADGFETCEALIVVDMLRRANLPIDTISMTGEYMVNSSQQVLVKADRLFQNFNLDEYECLILPGGKLGTKNLEANQELLEIIQKHVSNGKLTCAICAAPSILGHLGLLKEKHYTCFPTFHEVSFQGSYEESLAVKDGNFITARGMGATIEFARTIIRELAGDVVLEDVESGMQYEHRKVTT